MIVEGSRGVLVRYMRISGVARPLGYLGLVMILVAMSAAVQAATWRVPSQCATIHAALESASYGDTILVAPGTYPIIYDLANANVIQLGICLTSEEGPGETILDLCGGWFCVSIEECEGVRVSGFTMRLDLSSSCDNWYPQMGVTCWNSTDVIVENCIFEDLHIGIQVTGTSAEWYKPIFRDNIMRRCMSGIECTHVEDAGRPYLLRNEITECLKGIDVHDSSPVCVGNEIISCRYGMYYTGACGGNCRMNTISRNTEYGVFLDCSPELATPGFNGGLIPGEANDFCDNGEYAIYDAYSPATAPIFAEFNYWGSRCPDSIQLFHGPVDFSPWVDSTHAEILNEDDCPDATKGSTWGMIKAMFR
jgi:hypothetical protein